MQEILIADFEDGTVATVATGELTDAGVTKDDLTLLTGPKNEEERTFSIVGDGRVAARLRLEGHSPKIRECFQWVGLDSEDSERLEDTIFDGGGVLIVSAPSGSVEMDWIRQTLADAGATNSIRIKTVGPSGETTKPALKVRSTVGEEPITEAFVKVQDTVTVERQAVRRKATPEDLEYFKDETYHFDESVEELVVEKVCYVTEEVVVRTERVSKIEELEERLRKMRVETSEQ